MVLFHIYLQRSHQNIGIYIHQRKSLLSISQLNYKFHCFDKDCLSMELFRSVIQKSILRIDNRSPIHWWDKFHRFHTEHLSMESFHNSDQKYQWGIDIDSIFHLHNFRRLGMDHFCIDRRSNKDRRYKDRFHSFPRNSRKDTGTQKHLRNQSKFQFLDILHKLHCFDKDRYCMEWYHSAFQRNHQGNRNHNQSEKFAKLS